MRDFVRLGPFHNFHGTNHGNGYSLVDGRWHCTLFRGFNNCRRGRAVINGDPVPVMGSRRASAASGKPPCTRRALAAGLKRGGLHGRVLGFGCAGRFAYAAVVIHDYEATVLFRAQNGGWKPASRGRYCPNAVPRRIRFFACETN